MEINNPDDISKKLQSLSKSDTDIAIDKLNTILSELPKTYSEFIDQAFIYKRVPKEYLLSSILFTISSSIGLTFYINELGYKNYGNCYFTIIGSRGDTKSEAIKIATKPIKEIDDIYYDNYINDLKNHIENESLPKRKQILIQNATIEAAHKAHAENPNSIGISNDEIFTLIEKMGNSNSRDGVPWRNFLLEGYTNGYVDISRKTTESFRIKETYPTLIGGLQFQFIPKLFANGNLESGFVDRLLFTTKLTSNDKLIWGEINSETSNNYDQAIKNILAYKKQSEMPDETKKQFQIFVSKEASKLIFNYTQELIIRQSEAKPIIKEYMSKMQISIQKFCVIIFMMKNSIHSTYANDLNEEVVNLAIDLNEFYFYNFKNIINQYTNLKKEEPTIEQIIKLAKKNKASQKAVKEITGLHKSTISRKWQKI